MIEVPAACLMQGLEAEIGKRDINVEDNSYGKSSGGINNII